jgi:hypothetical protein
MWQPEYAAHRIHTFPVKNKRPAIRGYQRVGSRASAELARQFSQAESFGFVVGKPSGLTILDVDTNDERVLADALSIHGKSPIVIRTGSANWQAWYRWNGESRKIRPNKSVPIDILGGGYVVAPPSIGRTRQYEIVEGNLDDIDQLPVMRSAIEGAITNSYDAGRISWGKRNDALWRHCMVHARDCDDFDTLLDVARTFSSMQCEPPLPDNEVMSAAQSAWKKTERGENRFGKRNITLAVDDADRLAIGNQDALVLLVLLRSRNRSNVTFPIANAGVSRILGWTRKRLSAARRRLLADGMVVQVKAPKKGKEGQPGHAALYRWVGS